MQMNDWRQSDDVSFFLIKKMQTTQTDPGARTAIMNES